MITIFTQFLHFYLFEDHRSILQLSTFLNNSLDVIHNQNESFSYHIRHVNYKIFAYRTNKQKGYQRI